MKMIMSLLYFVEVYQIERDANLCEWAHLFMGMRFSFCVSHIMMEWDVCTSCGKVVVTKCQRLRETESSILLVFMSIAFDVGISLWFSTPQTLWIHTRKNFEGQSIFRVLISNLCPFHCCCSVNLLTQRPWKCIWIFNPNTKQNLYAFAILFQFVVTLWNENLWFSANSKDNLLINKSYMELVDATLLIHFDSEWAVKWCFVCVCLMLKYSHFEIDQSEPIRIHYFGLES